MNSREHSPKNHAAVNMALSIICWPWLISNFKTPIKYCLFLLRKTLEKDKAFFHRTVEVAVPVALPVPARESLL